MLSRRIYKKLQKTPKTLSLYLLYFIKFLFLKFGYRKSNLGPYLELKDDITTYLSLAGYDRIVSNTISELKQGDVFIDIGANIGVFSLYASKIVGPKGFVFSFEPNKSVFKYLVNNASRNNLSKNMFMFNVGVSNSTELCNFKFKSKHTGAGHLVKDEKSTNFHEQIMTFGPRDLLFLNNFCVNKKIIIKIDVEGAEVIVLNSIKDFLFSQDVQKVIIEINNGHLKRFNSCSKDIYQIMKELKYTSKRKIDFHDHYDEVFSKT